MPRDSERVQPQRVWRSTVHRNTNYIIWGDRGGRSAHSGFVDTPYGSVPVWTGTNYTHFHLMKDGVAYGYTADRAMTPRQMVYWAGRLMRELRQ